MNISLNLLRAERLLLGQLAAKSDRSMGAYVRELLFSELKRREPAATAEIIEGRRHRRATVLGVLGVAAVIFAGLPDSGIDLRRAPKTASVRSIRRVEDFA